MSEERAAIRSDLLISAGSHYTGLWEAWWEANGRLPDRPLSQRLALAEDVVRDLLGAGLIKLYRGPWIGDDFVEVPPGEVEELLRRWSSWVTDQDPLIWFLTTDEGDRELHG